MALPILFPSLKARQIEPRYPSRAPNMTEISRGGTKIQASKKPFLNRKAAMSFRKYMSQAQSTTIRALYFLKSPEKNSALSSPSYSLTADIWKAWAKMR